MTIARHVTVVAAATLASRILGFIRDLALASLFGAGMRADAFVVAFQFTNLGRRLLTEGALNAAFVPLYLRHRDASEGAAAFFAGRAVGSIALVLLVLAIVLALAMPVLMLGLVPGFSSDVRMDLAVELARIMLPYLVLAGPVAVLSGVLNANHRFSIAALIAVAFNLVMLLALGGALLWHTGDSDLSARIAAMAIVAAGLCQLMLVGFAVCGMRGSIGRIGLLSGRETIEFASLAVPGLVASAMPQLIIIAGVMAGSTVPSAAAWLYYANRLVELPAGIIAVAIGTVMTPMLSHARRDADHELAPRTIQHGLELTLGLALPAAVGLFFLATPIIRTLFEHGAFTPTDSAATAAMLALLAIGLPGQVLFRALSAVFFSHEDARIPMHASAVGLLAAVAGCLGSAYLEWVAGITLAIAASSWISTAILWEAAGRRHLFAFSRSGRKRLTLIVVSAIIMGAGLHAAALAFPFTAASRGIQAVQLAGLIIFAGALYAGCLWLFRVLRPSEIRTAMRRV